MTFKQNWEKTSTRHVIPDDIVEAMVSAARPGSSHALIAGGCANLNIFLTFEDEPYPLILRIYLRDPDAVYREQQLGIFLLRKVPVPQMLYVGEMEGYRFALVSHIPGITLRDLLLSDRPHDIGILMKEVGTILSNITNHTFPRPGHFDCKLKVNKRTLQDGLLTLSKGYLKKAQISGFLHSDTSARIMKNLDQHASLLPEKGASHLVHGDFDPSNILVDQSDGCWHVRGILDWEFAFAGSVLWDVANMLRYSHHMPPVFESSFLKGLKTGGIVLPNHWQITISLLNIIALLDCLVITNILHSPCRLADIQSLINTHLKKIEVHKW